MIPLAQLWLPIVVSAIGVFIASSLVHMVFKWHNSDFLKLPNEDEVRAAIRKGNPAPGQYVTPHCPDMKEMQTPEVQKKFTEGPVGFVVLRPPGPPKIGPSLMQWFVFNLLVAAIAAHLAAGSLPAGAASRQVFHLVGAITFLTYAGGAIQNGIWMGKPWRSVTKDQLDALIYAVVSAAAFAWLWPHA